MLPETDGIGFSMHETMIPADPGLKLWYKHHLEAVYVVADKRQHS